MTKNMKTMHGYLRYTGALKIKVWLVLLIQYAMLIEVRGPPTWKYFSDGGMSWH